MNDNTLKLVLTNHWFEEIKSGHKTHEYRECKWFWIKRIIMGAQDREDIYRWTIGDSDFENLPRDINEHFWGYGFMYGFCYVEFQKAYRKNAEKMLINVRNVTIINGKSTDLNIDKWVFDIELGERIK